MNTRTISLIQLVNPQTYTAYKALVEGLVKKGKTTGAEQSEQKVAYTKLNLQRINRVEKQFSIMPALENQLILLQPNWHWLVLAEAWCGDAAQLLPAIDRIASVIPGIELTVLLRDENPLLMDSCLTNGSRAIPKLICKDLHTQKRVFTWGPRPAAIQEQLLKYQADNPDDTPEEVALQLHAWYAQDRCLALQQDLLQLIKEELNKQSSTAALV
ncbi:thioredoxin family protein [Pontibacter silvestris]|uniref:Thioredoxin family protein n=1 Tax=Pontibacter silvestris TaxID=2305183 RepID=A0ABW4X4E6_9BACT|nr:thioredoxin family protein [Pontibacter silvestris]MCC9135123.1 thioredoxin family protein [Pontibacter silvestris]